jgi:hypothetical protein
VVYLITNKKRIIVSVIKKELNETHHSDVIVDNSVKSHANDPYVLKKVEKAKQMVNKYGLPGDKKK